MKWYAKVHYDKARFNFAFSEHIAGLGEDHNGWRVTSLFYAAVHLVEAYLFKPRRREPRSHNERADAIRANPVLNGIWAPYARLENLSRIARYGTVAITDTEVMQAVEDHEAIYDHIAALLGEPPLHSPERVEGESEAEGSAG